MIQLFARFSRQTALLMASLFAALILVATPSPAYAAGNGVNVIIMIGDGMGWEMARAAAVANGAPFYQNGKGRGLSFQNLAGYALMTTYGTTIQGTNGVFSTGNSALDDSNPTTGQSAVRPGFSFKPLPFNAGTTATGGATDPSLGNLVGYEPDRGGPNPWTPGSDPTYIKWSYPDSANTATSLYTGVKSYNNAIGVDIFEKNLTTILQQARELGKSTGLVTSVPITHATPGAATATVNRRAKYDRDFPALDNILQEALVSDEDGSLFLPTVLLGGGHPLDHENTINDPARSCDAIPEAANRRPGTCYFPPGTNNYVYIRRANYEHLQANPTNNRYGYRFLERGANAATTLLNTSLQLDPNQGQRLLGLYGARGQNGNIPVSSGNGDYSLTGLNNFSVFSSTRGGRPTVAEQAADQTPNPDVDRPLQPGETTEQFIAKEVNENPTLSDMTQAALNVLGKDQDGFWLMVEGGDIDWAAHDNNMDNLIGTMKDFDKAVQTTINWINQNGGWRKNVLIVTADHDHYLTLNDNFPQLLAEKGAEALTFVENTPAGAGHFWGSSPEIKYGWGNHSNRPVPVYYQGGPFDLSRYVGRGYNNYGFDVPGIPGLIDQTHIYQAMYRALTAPVR